MSIAIIVWLSSNNLPVLHVNVLPLHWCLHSELEENTSKSITGSNPELCVRSIFKTWQAISMEIWYVYRINKRNNWFDITYHYPQNSDVHEYKRIYQI
jgi:hypothetical protein